jgi:pseudaminic acid biosynthesis-associated methylase
MVKTEQESFWMGDFGTQYTVRNTAAGLVPANIALFARILRRTHGVTSVLEFGANSGMNLRAIKHLLPDAKLTAVEINYLACLDLKEWGGCEVVEGSMFDYEIDGYYDLTLSKGLLIHIGPDKLHCVYSKLYDASKKYILISEYYNPTPVEVSYRGHAGKLFKRDFAGDMLDRYPVKLIDYGFVYHRDPNFKQDDTTWFLMEKC